MSDVKLYTQISLLYQLHKLDLTILTYKAKIQEILTQIKEFEKKFDLHKVKLQELRKKVDRIKVDLNSRSNKVDLIEEKRKRALLKLQDAVDNKTYSAANAEIEHLNNQQSNTEDGMLELMLDIEHVEQEIEDLEEEVNKVKTIYDVEKQKYTDSAATIQENIDQMYEEREKISEQIDDELLEKYNARFKRQRVGLVAKIENESSCGHCNMTIPLQHLNEARLYEKPITCPSCKMILYTELEAELKTEKEI